ncbi:hypothetical protein [Erythrobacter sp. R86502]|uniref:hypothetical protein n=1 Tax=Erythrobacter sp. R86502 TaxID=3093846 RepID=UPI0036D40DD3
MVQRLNFRAFDVDRRNDGAGSTVQRLHTGAGLVARTLSGTAAFIAVLALPEYSVGAGDLLPSDAADDPPEPALVKHRRAIATFAASPAPGLEGVRYAAMFAPLPVSADRLRLDAASTGIAAPPAPPALPAGAQKSSKPALAATIHQSPDRFGQTDAVAAMNGSTADLTAARAWPSDARSAVSAQADIAVSSPLAEDIPMAAMAPAIPAVPAAAMPLVGDAVPVIAAALTQSATVDPSAISAGPAAVAQLTVSRLSAADITVDPATRTVRAPTSMPETDDAAKSAPTNAGIVALTSGRPVAQASRPAPTAPIVPGMRANSAAAAAPTAATLASLPLTAIAAPASAPRVSAPSATVARLITRVDGKASGAVDFEQSSSGIKVRLGSIAEVLADRIDAAQLARIRSSAAGNAWLSLGELQAQGIPISYDPVYDEFNVSHSDTRPKNARKVHMDQISAIELRLDKEGLVQRGR